MIEVLKDPQKLNLLFSALALLGGLAVYWLWHPDVFHAHPFVERAYEFWILRWTSYVMTWGLIAGSSDQRFALAANDLNTVLGFGLVVCLWRGDSYDAPHTKMNLVFLFGLLFSWNFVAHSLIGAGPAWIYPSMTMSLIFIVAMASVMLARCGMQAFILALSLLAYVLLQMPAYEIVFLRNTSVDPQLIQWLGIGKLLYSGLFYAVFPSAVKDFQPIHLPSIPITNDRLRRATSWVAVTVGGGILTEAVLWLAKHGWQVLSGRPLLT